MSARVKERAPAAAPAPIDLIVETVIYLESESRRLARDACQRVGITATQLNVLKLLEEIGELSLSELSRRLAAQNSSVTGIVDRMVQAFENGLTVETSDLMPSMDYVHQLSHLDGMNDIVDALGVGGNPAAVASAVEFVLEGLHLNPRLNKAAGDGPARLSR
jgi:hypothetical protein